VDWILDFTWSWTVRIGRGVWAWGVENPFQAIIVVIAIARLFGTTVQSGQVGVLFRFGRVRRVVDVGFTWLLPGLETVQKMHARAITLDLPPQRVATADGLVYDASATVVYRLRDPIRAVVEVADLTEGVETVVALTAYEVLEKASREEIADREKLHEAFAARARERLDVWGVDVDRAAYTTIAGTRETLRITQIGLLARERREALARLREGGVPHAAALLLLGASRVPVSHSHARYRAAARRRGARGAAMITRVRLKMSPDEREKAEAMLKLAMSDGPLASGAQQSIVDRGRDALPLLELARRRTGRAEPRLAIEVMRSRIEAAEEAKRKKGMGDGEEESTP
jgi:regulator of protease activity HflC (stomatin/prohibitin superfamily)